MSAKSIAWIAAIALVVNLGVQHYQNTMAAKK